MKRHFREWSVAAALGLLLLVLAWRAPKFFLQAQLLSTLSNTVPVLVVGAGMAVVILCRQIDVSVGSQFAVCSVLLGLAARAQLPLPVVGLTAILAGSLLGACNGILIAGLGLPSIVVTLATMVTWREGLRWWLQGAFIRDLPEKFQWFGLGQAVGQLVVIALATLGFALVALALRYLSAGRYVYAVGSDAEAARLSGIPSRGITFGAFVFVGAFAGMAALLNAVRFTDVDPKTGTGLELQAIAAAVVGGISISGGRGSLWGVSAGVLLLGCIAPALVFLGWQPQWEKAFQGSIILLAVAADGWRNVRRASKE